MTNYVNKPYFVDILQPHRKRLGGLRFATKPWNPVFAVNRGERVNLENLKQDVLNSERLDYILEKVAEEQNMSIKELKRQIKLLLDEIGCSKDLTVIRGLSVVLVNALTRMCSNIYVNIGTVERLKKSMGQNPVIFLPNHRSYADFILMAYICYSLDLELPLVAAGMDFYAMWGMGNILRETGAFFMRRQFANDQLYSNVFAEYVRKLVTHGDSQIEFFIEGTRSRSLKSLPPKFGLLSMALKPFFFGEVPDISIVPVSINYNRIMEENLFASELLGVPKPKESTAGLFKSLNIIKSKYGDVIFNFAEPLSARNYFQNVERSSHALSSISSQQLSEMEMEQITKLAYDVIYIQQKNCVVTATNIIALILNNNLIMGYDCLKCDHLINDMKWLKSVFEKFGAIVILNDVVEALNKELECHNNLFVRTPDNVIKLVKSVIVFQDYNKKQLKGHDLSSETMNAALPMVKLQLYVNPCMHFIIGKALTVLVLAQYCKDDRGLNKDEIWNHFQWLCRLFAFEFVIYQDRERMEFEDSIQKLQELNVIIQNNNEEYIKGVNNKLYNLLCNCLSPFIVTYDTVCEVLLKAKTECAEKEILSEVQKRVEELFNDTITKYIHPYALSLDTIKTALQSFTQLKGLERIKRDNLICYMPITQVLSNIRSKLGSELFNNSSGCRTNEDDIEFQSSNTCQTLNWIQDILNTFNTYFDLFVIICAFLYLFIVYLFKTL